MKLNDAERDVLVRLGDPEPPARHREVIDDTLRHCVNSIRSPAFVLSPQWDVVYWNDAFAAAWLIDVPGSAPFNAVEYQFSRARERGLQGKRWELMSRRMAAQFRADYLARAGDPLFQPLIDRLRAIPVFREMYDTGDVISSLADVPNAIEHPILGLIDYVTYNLAVPDTGLTLTVQLVSDEIAAALAARRRTD